MPRCLIAALLLILSVTGNVSALDSFSAPENAPVIPWKRFSIQYTVRALAGDGPKKVEFFMTTDGGKTWKLYGADADRKSPMTISVKKDGTYGFMTVGTDHVGNRERVPTPGTRPETFIIVDRTPPTAEWISPSASQVLNSNGIKLAWKCTDKYLAFEPVTIQYSTDSGSTWLPLRNKLPAVGSFQWKPPSYSGGQVLFRLTARDRAGNNITVKSKGVLQIDKTAPTIEILSPAISAKQNINVNFDASDNVGGTGLAQIGLYYSLNDGRKWHYYGTDEDNKSPMPFLSPQAGYVGLYMVAIDVAGNKKVTPTPGTAPQFRVMIDNEAPELTLSQSFGHPNNSLRSEEVTTIEWTATDANIKDYSVSLEYSIDNRKTWRAIDSSLPVNKAYTWRIPKLRSKTTVRDCFLRISVQDKLGNIGKATSQKFEIDPMPPVTKIDVITAPVNPDRPLSDAVAPSAAGSRNPGGRRYPTTQPIRDHGDDTDLTGSTSPTGSRATTEDTALTTELSNERPSVAGDFLGEGITDAATAEVGRTGSRARTTPSAEITSTDDDVELTSTPRGTRVEETRTTIERTATSRIEEDIRREEEARLAEETKREALRKEAKRLERLRKLAEEERLAKLKRERGYRDEAGTPGGDGETEAPTGTDPTLSEAASFAKQAHAAFVGGNTPKAIELCKKSIKADAGFAMGHAYMSTLMASTSSFKKAIEFAQTATRLKPREPAYHDVLGDAYFKFAKSLREERKLMSTTGGPHLATINDEIQKAIRQARIAFEEVRALDPNKKEGHDKLADIEYFTARISDQLDDKETAYKNAIALYSKGYAIGEGTYKEAFQIGVCSYHIKDYKNAQRWLERSIEHEGKPRHAFFYLGKLHDDLKNPAEALEYWKRAKKHYDKKSTYYRYASDRVEKIKDELETP